jgi:hypothetical protein
MTLSAERHTCYGYGRYVQSLRARWLGVDVAVRNPFSAVDSAAAALAPAAGAVCCRVPAHCCLVSAGRAPPRSGRHNGIGTAIGTTAAGRAPRASPRRPRTQLRASCLERVPSVRSSSSCRGVRGCCVGCVELRGCRCRRCRRARDGERAHDAGQGVQAGARRGAGGAPLRGGRRPSGFRAGLPARRARRDAHVRRRRGRCAPATATPGDRTCGSGAASPDGRHVSPLGMQHIASRASPPLAGLPAGVARGMHAQRCGLPRRRRTLALSACACGIALIQRSVPLALQRFRCSCGPRAARRCPARPRG